MKALNKSKKNKIDDNYIETINNLMQEGANELIKMGTIPNNKPQAQEVQDLFMAKNKQTPNNIPKRNRLNPIQSGGQINSFDLNYVKWLTQNNYYKLLENKKYKVMKKFLENYGKDFDDYFSEYLKNRILPLYILLVLLIVILISNTKMKNLDDSDKIIYASKIVYYWLIISIIITITIYIILKFGKNEKVSGKIILILFGLLIFIVFIGYFLLKIIDNIENKNVENEYNETKTEDTMDDKLKKILIYFGICLGLLFILYIIISKLNINNKIMILPLIGSISFMGYEIYNNYFVKQEIIDDNNDSTNTITPPTEDEIKNKIDTLLFEEYDEKYNKYSNNEESKYDVNCVSNYVKKTNLLPTYGPICNKNYVNNTFVSKIVDSLF